MPEHTQARKLSARKKRKETDFMDYTKKSYSFQTNDRILLTYLTLILKYTHKRAKFECACFYCGNWIFSPLFGEVLLPGIMNPHDNHVVNSGCL